MTIHKRKYLYIYFMVFAAFTALGCTRSRGNVGQVQSFEISDSEAKWIRNGEPIEYEGEWWYPQDGIEGLMDSEVILLGEYRETQFFVDKIDVRPFDRLYTKFGNNQFRFFKKRKAE